MIIIAGEFKTKTEHRAEAIKAMQRMAKASQVEAGCLAYQCYADLETADTFFLFEIWETEEALAAHRQTAHMADIRKILPKVLAADLKLTHYQAETVE